MPGLGAEAARDLAREGRRAASSSRASTVTTSPPTSAFSAAGAPSASEAAAVEDADAVRGLGLVEEVRRQEDGRARAREAGEERR